MSQVKVRLFSGEAILEFRSLCLYCVIMTFAKIATAMTLLLIYAEWNGDFTSIDKSILSKIWVVNLWRCSSQWAICSSCCPWYLHHPSPQPHLKCLQPFFHRIRDFQVSALYRRVDCTYVLMSLFLVFMDNFLFVIPSCLLSNSCPPPYFDLTSFILCYNTAKVVEPVHLSTRSPL